MEFFLSRGGLCVKIFPKSWLDSCVEICVFLSYSGGLLCRRKLWCASVFICVLFSYFSFLSFLLCVYCSVLCM